MIPVVNNLKEVEVIEQPSLCHRMIFDDGRISGECDGVEAVKQAIYNILNTERYQYIIYSWNYGVELKDLFWDAGGLCGGRGREKNNRGFDAG